MANTIKTNQQGIYYFADGTWVWCRGMSVRERNAEIRKHGQIVRFEPKKLF